MNSDNGRINYQIGLDNSLLRTQATETTNILKGITRNANDEGANIDQMFKRIGVSIASAFSVTAAVEFAHKVMAVRSEIEGLEISFKTLLGNETKANAMFSEIRRFAVETPMQLKDLAGAAQMMLSFNIEDTKIMPYLKALGDISMGDTQRFNSLALAFSQMSSTGKLMGQDLMQMINAGFNPLAQIAEKTGKSIKELKDEMSAGKITAEMVQQAFIDATSAGGKYYGMLEQQSKGLRGSVSNLQGAIDDMLNDIGIASQGAMSGVINTATELVKNYKEVAEIIITVVGAYGLYKAAIITHEAIARNAHAQVAASYAAEAEAINALLLQKQAEVTSSTAVQTADIKAALAKGRLTEAEAEVIIASRTAIAERRKALSLTLQEAIEAEKIAKQKLKIALEESIAAKKQLAIEREKLMAMNSYELHVQGAAQKEAIHTASVNANTAAVSVNNAKKELAIATSNKKTAAQTLETLGTQADTVAKGTNTAATSLLSVVTNGLKNACEKLWVTMKANPYAIILGAVAALGYALYKLVTYQTESEKATKRLEEASKKLDVVLVQEEIEIERLFNNLRRAKKGTEEYDKAKNDIISKYGKYIEKLNEEVRTLKDVEAAYNAVRTAALEAAQARMHEEFIKDESDTLAKALGDNVEKARKLIAKKFGEKFAAANEDAIRDIIWGGAKINSKFLKYFDKRGLAFNGQSTTGGIKTDVVIENALADIIKDSEDSRKVFDDTLKKAELRYGQSKEKKEGEKVIPENYQEGLKKATERYQKADEDLKKLLKDKAHATSEEVKNAREELSAAEKSLKDDYGVDIKANARAASKAQQQENRERNEANRIAVQTAERERKIKQQAAILAKAEREKERAITQAAIDAEKDGLTKQLMQNQLDYQRLLDANEDRRDDMLERLRDLAELKWENENPNAEKEEGKIFDRDTISAELLDLGQDVDYTLLDKDLAEHVKKMRGQLREYQRIADETLVRANKKNMEEALTDILSYAEKREKIEKEFAQREEELYNHDSKGRRTGLKEGVSEGNLSELNRQEEEALKAVDEEFAQREEHYQAWCEQMASWTLKELKKKLQEAKDLLDEMMDDGDVDDQTLAIQRAKINKLSDRVKKEDAKDKSSPDKRSLKEWQDLYKTLQDCEKEFEAIGDAVGGTAGEIISTAGQIASSSLTMINGIVQLVQMSKVGIEGTALAGATAISTMEKASIILTIISAAMQIAMTIVSLFNSDNKKQKEIERLQEMIDKLKWENEHADIMRYTTLEDSLNLVIEKLNETRLNFYRNKAAAGDLWGAYIALCGSARANTELLNKSAQKLADTFAQMKYTSDKALGEDRYKEARGQLENLAKQQILLSEQIEAEHSKKKSDSGAIEEYKQKIAELGQEMTELINDLVEDIIGNSAADMAKELGDAFVDAFQSGEDAAEKWGEKVNDIVSDILKRMLVQEFLEKPLGSLFDKYREKWFPNGMFTSLEDVRNSMPDFAAELNGMLSTFEDNWASIPDEIKNLFDSERQGLHEGIAAASQDSIDDLNARMTTVQGHTYSISENTKILISTAMRILESVVNIDRNTDNIHKRVGVVETCVKDLRNTLNDISLKGIRLI